MSELERLEKELRSVQGGIDLRTTLQKAILEGAILTLIKMEVLRLRQETWYDWCRRNKVNARTASRRMQVAKDEYRSFAADTRHKLSIEKFLGIARKAKRAARRAEMDTRRQAAAEAGERLPEDKAYQVVHADCREYCFPKNLDCISTDPPWADREAYRWLATFSASHLRDGGLLLCQCGNGPDLPCVLDMMREAGLSYHWTMAIVYEDQGASKSMMPPWISSWRPVLVFSRGQWDRGRIPAMSDTYTVRSRMTKDLHPWQQPLQPWAYWLSRLTLPGQVIADPFLGAGTNLVALKMAGGRQGIGTDRDSDNVMIARQRLADTEEGGNKP